MLLSSPSKYIGRLVRSDLEEIVFRCDPAQPGAARFGTLVCVEAGPGLRQYGLVYGVRWEEDGLVRQLAGRQDLPLHVIADNRLLRIGGPEIAVILCGYQTDQLYFTFPPSAAASLTEVVELTWDELADFVGHGLGYLRLLLRARDRIPLADLLAAHLNLAGQARSLHNDPNWTARALQEISVLLREDYSTSLEVTRAVQSRMPDWFSNPDREEEE